MNRYITFLLSLCLLQFSSISTAGEIAQKTRALDGTMITYNYTNGMSFKVKYEKHGVSYRNLAGAKPETWWGPFPYNAFEVQEDVFMVAWFEKGYGDYVTQLIYFKENILYGSAIIKGKGAHFNGAKIVEIKGYK